MNEDPRKALKGDPIDQTTNKHSTATNVGMAAGAVAGGILGSSFGPLGAVTGAILGAGTGAIAGLGITESLDPTADEQQYWEGRYKEEPYYESRHTFEDYGPAYRLGWKHYIPGKSFESSESDLIQIWAHEKESSTLSWDFARHAVKASWERMERKRSGSQSDPGG